MARGIIRKMIRGAAEAGVPMLQEQHRNNILQNRETAMARIQNQYRTQDREAEQSFTAEQNAMDREQRAGEFEANRLDAAEGRAMQQQGLDMQRQQLGLTAMQVSQALEQGKFGITEARRLQGINDVITNPDSTPEQLDQAITMLQNLKNTDPEKFSAITLYGEDNGYGQQLRRSGVLNSKTGQITPAAPAGASSTSAGASIPQAAIDALLGEPSRERITAFNQKYGPGSAERYIRPEDSSTATSTPPKQPPANTRPTPAQEPETQTQRPTASFSTSQGLDVAAAIDPAVSSTPSRVGSFTIEPSLSQRIGQYIDNQGAGALPASSFGTGKIDALEQAQAKAAAEWLQSYIDRGVLPGTGPLNTPKIKLALESGLLDITDEQLGEIYGYISTD